MGRTRMAALGANLWVMLALVACGPAAPPVPQRRSQVPPPTVARPVLNVDQLHEARNAPIPVAALARNPFRFGGGGQPGQEGSRSTSLAPLPPPEGLPVLPLPLATPPLRLLGLLTFPDGGRLAVISVGSDLVMARTGELISGRFRVGAIKEDAVEVTDAVGDRSIRLALP